MTGKRLTGKTAPSRPQGQGIGAATAELFARRVPSSGPRHERGATGGFRWPHSIISMSQIRVEIAAAIAEVGTVDVCSTATTSGYGTILDCDDDAMESLNARSTSPRWSRRFVPRLPGNVERGRRIDHAHIMRGRIDQGSAKSLLSIECNGRPRHSGLAPFRRGLRHAGNYLAAIAICPGTVDTPPFMTAESHGDLRLRLGFLYGRHPWGSLRPAWESPHLALVPGVG